MDDLKKFQSDLDVLMLHTRRRMAMLDGVGRFIDYMLGTARTEDRMLGHFILREHNAPPSPFLTPYPDQGVDQGVDPGFQPEAVEEEPPPPPPRQFAPPPPPPPPAGEDMNQRMKRLREEMFRPQGD